MSEEKQVTPKRGPMNGGPMGGMARQMPTKPKDFKKSIKKLFKFMADWKTAIIISVVLASFGTIISLYGPQKISDLTDLIYGGIVTGINLGKVGGIAILLGCLYIAAAAFNYIQGYIMAGVTQRAVKKLRSDISNKINKLPLKYYDNTSVGDTLSRAVNDVDTVGNSLNQSIVQLISAVLMFVGSIIMMFITNWLMAITAIVSTFGGFIIMMIIIKQSQKHFILQQKSLGALNGHIEEMYSGHNVVKAYNGIPQATAKFDAINNNLYSSAWKSQFFSGLMMPLMGFIGNFGYLSVAVVGGALAFGGHITLGVISAFMIYVRLFSQPLNQIAQGLTSMQSATAASERVFELLEAGEMENENSFKKHDKAVKGNVTFENVEFGYNPEKIIIKNFNADVKAGQKVAIVGPTGAGKTTMVNLLMKFYKVNGGSIKIDGVDINNMTRECVHDVFAMVLQDTWLFNGTIKDNIVYNVPNITQEQVEETSKAVGLHHFITTLPNGYETVLGDNASISAGQRQLVTIARAMIKNAPLLILDEATSSVDTRTEMLIAKAMDKLMKNRTSFIIAHRLSTIKNADIILVMRDGNIVESGNHNDLLKKGGFYAELYNSQFEN